MGNLKNEVVEDEEAYDEEGISLFKLILIGALVLFVGWLALVELGILSASCH